jgi:hypothetical protein
MPNSIQPVLEVERSKIADSIAVKLSCLSPKASVEFLRLLLLEVAQKQTYLSAFAEEMSAFFTRKSATGVISDPSDIGAPPGAPKPVPVPPEILEAAIRDFNEAEIVEAIQELRREGGYQLKDIIPTLEAAIGQPLTPQKT